MDLKCLLKNVCFFRWTNHRKSANVCAKRNNNNKINKKRKYQTTFDSRSNVLRVSSQVINQVVLKFFKIKVHLMKQHI